MTFRIGLAGGLLALLSFVVGAADASPPSTVVFAAARYPVAGVQRVPHAEALRPCVADTLGLAEVWVRYRRLEPAYEGVDAAERAEMAAGAAVRREWLPTLSVGGVVDQGQRLSPGEERVLGPGPRGELRLLGSWTLLDSGRGARMRAADARLSEARAGALTLDVRQQAMVARVYLEAVRTGQVLAVLRERLDALEATASGVRLRVEEGVAPGWESERLEDEVARLRRELADAGAAAEVARIELATLVGECIHPRGIFPTGGVALDSPGGDPEEERLRTAARAMEAEASAASLQDRWTLDLVGTTGPTYSRAFDEGRVRNEYLLGVSLDWRPDLFGAQRQTGVAGRERARIVQAEAESRAFFVGRELERLAGMLEHAERRRGEFVLEVEAASAREEVVHLRWEAGVAQWTELVDARRRLAEVLVGEIELNNEVAMSLLEYAEWTGRMDLLPRWLDGAR